MTGEKLLSLTALQLGKAIKAGETTAVEAARLTLENIKVKDKLNNCYITTAEDYAIKRAQQVQQQIEAGILMGPLAGVPIAVKDNLCTKGIRTTCGSKMLEHFFPPYSATAVERLEAAGMILVGKTNMDEFAMGSTTETSYFGPTLHPLDKTRVAGGSSGGSGAAVANEECYIALGSDTGGSVRQPASHCGVVGIKPSYGLVSRYGLVAYASSMDQIGPLGKDVADCAALLDIIMGRDERDATSVAPPWKEKDFGTDIQGIKRDIQGLKIGIPREYLVEGLDKDIKTAVIKSAGLLERAGATVEYFSLEHMDKVVPVYYILADAEASSNLARFDGVKYGHQAEQFGDLHELYKRSRQEGFGPETKNRILAGTFVLSAGYYDDYYRRALQLRDLVKASFDRIFQSYDVILAPVTPATAPQLGESLQDPIAMYLADVYTVPANLAGLPAMSLPAGKDACGMPVGVQLMANRMCDNTMLRVGYALEAMLTEKEKTQQFSEADCGMERQRGGFHGKED